MRHRTPPLVGQSRLRIDRSSRCTASSGATRDRSPRLTGQSSRSRVPIQAALRRSRAPFARSRASLDRPSRCAPSPSTAGERPSALTCRLPRSREPKRRTFLRSPSMVDPIDLIPGESRRDAGAPRRTSVDRPRARPYGTTGPLVHRGLTSTSPRPEPQIRSRLSTPGFASRHLRLRRWSATGLSGDYPGGTSTRWSDTTRHAPFDGPSHRTCGCAFTTHHEGQYGGYRPRTHPTPTT